MNNIICLSPIWTIVFILAALVLCITLCWNKISALWNNIRIAPPKIFWLKNLKEFLTDNIWIIIAREIMAIILLLYAVKLCEGAYWVLIVGGIITFSVLLSTIIMAEPSGNELKEILKIHLLVAVLLTFVAISGYAFLCVSASTAFICLICAIIAAIVLPKTSQRKK